MMKAIYLVLIAVLTGCVSQYKFAGGEKSADLTIAGNSKNFFVDAYKDASCAVSEYGERLATFYGPTANVQDKETGITVPVPTGKELYFSIHRCSVRAE
jgi:hypothetical protein